MRLGNVLLFPIAEQAVDRVDGPVDCGVAESFRTREVPTDDGHDGEHLCHDGVLQARPPRLELTLVSHVLVPVDKNSAAVNTLSGKIVFSFLSKLTTWVFSISAAAIKYVS